MARYGFDVSQWDEDMQDALEIIAEVARNEETITYSEFAEELGGTVRGISASFS